jgi:pimeloyl-ACP methyl ester carboxylesterase
MANGKSVFKIFIGGGGDDWFSHIVEGYSSEYAALNPDLDVKYFSWTQGVDISNHLLYSIPQLAHITIVGHSYGADTAFSVLRNTRTVDLLVSIDPVGRFKVPWPTTRGATRKWLNTRAEPTATNKTTDDTIAAIGGKYPRPPALGAAGAPDFSHIVDATHGAFRVMMRFYSDGSPSGKTLLGGTNVA